MANEIILVYQNGYETTEWLGETLVHLGEDRYRFEVEPLGCFSAESERDLVRLPRYRDEFEAEAVGSGRILFKRVVKRAPLRRFEWLVSMDMVNDSRFEEIMDKAAAEGGYAERIMGGILIMYLPKDSDFDPDQELEGLRRSDA